MTIGKRLVTKCKQLSHCHVSASGEEKDAADESKDVSAGVSPCSRGGGSKVSCDGGFDAITVTVIIVSL